MNVRPIYLSTGLVLLTAAVFIQVGGHDFLIYDDPQYVFENRWIRNGLTLEGAIRAFSTAMAANWHPITWLSHMLDVSLFGLDPGYHHLVNLLIHVLNTLLLFRILDRMTGDMWRSAFVSALFAIHPTHVESVAWIAERKDLLCAFFGFMTIRAYLEYANSKRSRHYAGIVVIYVLCLMSKPMFVTMPFVLLLVDYWPLERYDRVSFESGNPFVGLLKEKIPLFALSAISCIVTVLAQRSGSALVPMAAFPLQARIGNAATASIKYIGKMFWPSRLSVFYPNPGLVLPPWEIAGAICLLAAATWIVVRYSAVKRYLPVGWFWFLGMLVPVIGLVQVGSQEMADRYTYLPYIGLFMIVVWGTSGAWEYRKLPNAALALIGVAILCMLSVVAWKQVGYWRNNDTLFTHMLQVVQKSNRLAHVNLGGSYLDRGNPSAALDQFAVALKEDPEDEMANWGMGLACTMLGRPDEGMGFIRTVLRRNPTQSKARLFLGCIMVDRGKLDDGYEQIRIVAESTTPDDPYKLLAQGIMLSRTGDAADAIRKFQEALAYFPNDILANMKLGLLLAKTGRFAEAADRFRTVIRYSPLDASAYYNLALALEQAGSLEEAVTNYEKALSLRPKDVEILANLGIALGKMGRLDPAIARFREAIGIDPGNEVARHNLAVALARKGGK